MLQNPTAGQTFVFGGGYIGAKFHIKKREDMVDRIAVLKQMIAQQPENALFHYTLGKELLNQGQAEEAVGSLKRSIELNPRYTAAYRELGQAFAKTGRVEEAIAIYQEGMRIGEETGDLQTVKEMRVFLNRLVQK